jgi:hypothetical protein
MEKESSGYRPVEANSTGGQGSRRAVAPSDDDDDDDDDECNETGMLEVKQESLTSSLHQHLHR